MAAATTRGFVDHLQILPVPSRGGSRPPDGAHRPGGLGMVTLAERLAARGWTARVEDLGFDKPLPAARMAEAYARAIGDGVLSAWDRNRFPVILSLAHFCALGVADAFGPDLGVLWISARGEYEPRGLLRRPSFDTTALALVTGSAARDRLAVAPRRLPAANVVLIGGRRAEPRARDALTADGIRIVAPEVLDEVRDAVASVDVPGWYVHVDAGAFRQGDTPAADEPDPEGLAPAELAATLETALESRPIRAIAFTRYDLNREGGDRTIDTLAGFLDRMLLVAGGQPVPTARENARAT